VEAVKAASVQQLMEVPSITEQVAENIRDYFK
jgi:excinuclease UvrABC nuclease subunit